MPDETKRAPARQEGEPETPEKDGEEEERREESDAGSVRLDTIEELGSVTTDSGGFRIRSLVIAGQVEGHSALAPQAKTTKYEHVLPLLVDIEESREIDGLLLLLNTMGGDVEAGLAIAEMVAGMRKPTVSLVLGGGHSIGVPLAVCADRSFIVPSATMTIHPVRMNGLVIGVPQSFSYFTKMQDRIVNFIVDHSEITREKLFSLMMETDEIATDVGSVIDGREAVSIGLIDAVGSLSDALDCLKDAIRARR